MTFLIILEIYKILFFKYLNKDFQKKKKYLNKELGTNNLKNSH